MTNAAIGHSSTFKRSSDGTSGGTMTALAEVISINGVNLTRETVDVTHLTSTNRYREFAGGLRDGGTVTIGLNFDPDGTDYTNAIADINSEVKGYYEVVFPDTSEWGFIGLAESVSLDTPMDDKMTVEIAYKVTGQPTFTSA